MLSKDELKRHQGTWITTSSIFDGQTASPEVVRSIKRIVTDDDVTCGFHQSSVFTDKWRNSTGSLWPARPK